VGTLGWLGSSWGHLLFWVVRFSCQPNMFPVIALLLLLDAPLPSAISNLHLLLFCFVSEKLSGIFGKLTRGLEPLISLTSGIGIGSQLEHLLIF
jgi:hypothetical protein